MQIRFLPILGGQRLLPRRACRDKSAGDGAQSLPGGSWEGMGEDSRLRKPAEDGRNETGGLAMRPPVPLFQRVSHSADYNAPNGHLPHFGHLTVFSHFARAPGSAPFSRSAGGIGLGIFALHAAHVMGLTMV